MQPFNIQETVSMSIRKIHDQAVSTTEEVIVEEAPLTIFLNGNELITVLCLPSEVEYLVVGLLVSEGIISAYEDIQSMEVDMRQGIANVELVNGKKVEDKLFLKRYLTSCCGKGRTAFYFANDGILTCKNDNMASTTSTDIIRYIQLLEEKSILFRSTGGVHSGALVQGGEIIVFSQDIGRHNVFDKLYGQCILEGIATIDKMIVFSGRVSAEIVMKVSKMQVPILIARSAPTSLALTLAEELGITVVGFARGNAMNVYTHASRVVYGDSD